MSEYYPLTPSPRGLILGPHDFFPLDSEDDADLDILARTFAEYLIVSDLEDHCVKVFNREQGIFLCKFTSVGDAYGQFDEPSFLAVDKAGHLMVCDTGNHRIQVFKLNGEFVAKFGTEGSELGEFDTPSGIAVLSDGRIVVSDTDNRRIQVFE
ncbi:E3 ubiquitin-protein ligase TRIM71-like [Orbicella faveolata]|uniref:E3 ubiquitin-protein ligase TRIM71-like n=1 Tax=Orbicella faveolata TaxID=48498 RepID=UPI0009E4A922|nr:E3 ubiquitin-protein ligase TRIM71-like [Orbicella faveolata]